MRPRGGACIAYASQAIAAALATSGGADVLGQLSGPAWPRALSACRYVPVFI
jgi:hypothetical protein